MKTRTLLLMCFIFAGLLNTSNTLIAEEPVNIPDPNLKSAIEEELDISDPNVADMLTLTSLSAWNRGISDITGLEFAANMQYLTLSDNQICNISPLAGLTNLRSLGLYDNQISNITPIKELTSLLSLDLSNNQISDISALSDLTNLKTLYLEYNFVEDISALSKMTKLESLHLDGNPLDINAYKIHIPLIYQNNPGVSISYYYHPAPPEKISASDGEFSDKIHISWDSVYSMNGDTLYMIYRSTGKIGSKKSISSWQTATSFDDTAAEGCTIYYYWIKAKARNYKGSEYTTDYSSYDTGWVSGECILNISSTKGGSVTAPGEGAFLYNSCNKTVTVTAIAEPNYYFINWSGTAVHAGKVSDCTSASTTVTVDKNYTLKANFITDANVIYVDDDGPADFNNIQEAIDSAKNGDTVLVADGIYNGKGNSNHSIDLIGKTITVKSQNGPKECIIDCIRFEDRNRFGFYIQDGNSILKGFTIKNAGISAISCQYADPLIIECTLTSNYSHGISCYKANPIIADCIITENSSSGIYISTSNSVIMRCQINSNYSQGNGGGVYCNNSGVNIINCTITGNSCVNDGGGVYCTNSGVNISNCTISGNRADFYGGGIFAYCNGEINNSIITDNFASSGNNIFVGTCYTVACPDLTINIVYSVIEKDLNSIIVPNYSFVLTGDWMDFDPLFADPGYWDSNSTPEDVNDDFWVDGDYHLKSQEGRFVPNTNSWIKDNMTSPCIDTGDPNSPIGDEPAPNGGYINIGAYGGTKQASKSPSWQFHPLSKASNPQPSNGAIDIEPNPVLKWTAGRDAVLHDVYFSTDFNDVNDATIINPKDALVSLSQEYNYYEPAQLEPNQTYYWRIDEVNESLVIAKGKIWKFKTDILFEDAYHPSPPDKVVDVSPDVILSWSPGLNASKHDVYIAGSLNSVINATRENPLGILSSQGQDSNSLNLGRLPSKAQRYWRIDEIDNQGNIITGKIWEFRVKEYDGRFQFTEQKPVCTTIVAGDINGDRGVDIFDLEIMISHWLDEH